MTAQTETEAGTAARAPASRRVRLKLAGAALRALEMGADAILMAKHGVKGVYDGDPRRVADAEFLPRITHLEAIERGLKVMDTTALSLCMDNRLTIHVFELAEGNVARVVAGEAVGTIIATPKEEG